MERENKVEFRDWSRIPGDILDGCCKRLDMPNQLRLGAVCKTWHSSTSNKAHLSTPDTPWLIANNETAPQFRLYSPTLRKVFDIHKPFWPFLGSFIVGSTHGWLLIRSPPQQLFILNVFSSLRIDLPARTTFPAFLKSPRTMTAAGLLQEKEMDLDPDADPPLDTDTPLAFAVSSCPNLNPINVAAVTKGGDLAWCNLTDQAWKGHRGDVEYGNLTFHDGKLYAVNRDGSKIDMFCADDESSPEQLVPLGSIDAPGLTVATIPDALVDVYLVESKGRLLVLKRYYDDLGLKQTIGFDVFKVEENCRVVTVNGGLDGQVLFMSDLNCESVDAQHCRPGLTSDRIYFIGHSRNGYTPELGGFLVPTKHMIRVPLTHLDVRRSPIWVLPRVAFECDCPTHDLALWKPNKNETQISTVSV